eukprot:CAMPEP_0181065692 /NCGR_PEP_ID=MMETSP1070-20121207/24872_1 /TAXON_ID=265543 /ORGANISM="Minutocellus polymorphus, Strain NH13" /LENGTH=237 /DNA_ID=CAMNT_0023146095 /DNA_START=126 /DNA_END=839 /DNA_ORIENTATION=+
MSYSFADDDVPVPQPPRAPIVVHDNDVLSGRGVIIAEHPGNKRYRALVSSHYDKDYCETYTTSEKRAVAENIIKHIRELDPPGRFLQRDGNCKKVRGLTGPWEVINHDAVVKKVCQALRDCNRQDRKGYANGVQQPDDVRVSLEKRKQSGLTNKQQAAAAAGAASAYMASYAQFDPQYAPAAAMPAAMAVGGMGGSDVDALAAAAAVVGDSPSTKRLRTEDGGHIPGPAGEEEMGTL